MSSVPSIFGHLCDFPGLRDGRLGHLNLELLPGHPLKEAVQSLDVEPTAVGQAADIRDRAVQRFPELMSDHRHGLVAILDIEREGECDRFILLQDDERPHLEPGVPQQIPRQANPGRHQQRVAASVLDLDLSRLLFEDQGLGAPRLGRLAGRNQKNLDHEYVDLLFVHLPRKEPLAKPSFPVVDRGRWRSRHMACRENAIDQPTTGNRRARVPRRTQRVLVAGQRPTRVGNVLTYNKTRRWRRVVGRNLSGTTHESQ